ncbi:unnamed protein product [Durusdinium trenchii]|uniref:Anoctamin n=1 Tax=Durusdinium trenchii TaxID=1381693 RepID=A0ABP0JQL1_9DINO
MVRVLSWLGVVFNTYLVIFVSPLCQNLSFEVRMLVFVAVEHALLILKVIIDAALGPKSTAQRRIEEHQDRVIERILQENNKTKRTGHLQVKSLSQETTFAGDSSIGSSCYGRLSCGSEP